MSDQKQSIKPDVGNQAAPTIKPSSTRSRNPSPIKWLLILIVGYGLGLATYKYLAVPGVQPVSFELVNDQPTDAYATQVTIDMGKFWQVLKMLEENYLNPTDIDPQEVVDGAISGMIDSLEDPYTAYYNREENQGFKEGLEGLYEGIGAQLGFKGDQVVIVAPLEDTPAERAGVKAGDFILAVDGDSTLGWSLPKTVDRIRGEANTEVVLTLMRGEGEPFDVPITRQTIRIPAVKLSWKDGNYAYVRILRFGSDTNQEWDQIVSELKMSGVQGIVLDVRNNPGGLLNSAIYLASDFFNNGVIVQRESNYDTTQFRVDHQCRLCDVPVVGLINEGSASASEILLGAIQSRARGEIVGTTSFGKGTVQEVMELNGGSAVHITTAKWLLPNGENIHDVGLTPDYVIEIEDEDVAGPFEEDTSDSQLDKALELLKMK